jgi:hypothetical protein
MTIALAVTVGSVSAGMRISVATANAAILGPASIGVVVSTPRNMTIQTWYGTEFDQAKFGFALHVPLNLVWKIRKLILFASESVPAVHVCPPVVGFVTVTPVVLAAT